MSARHRYGAAGLALLVLTVSACSGGGGEPGKTSSTTASNSSSTSSGTKSPSSAPPSSAATPTVDPADLPADARKHTPEGAAAFVKYFIQQSNEAWTGPDASLIPPLSDSGCISCKALQKTAAELNTKKQRYRSSPVTLSSVKAFSGGPRGQQYVRVVGTQNRVDVIDAAGRVVLTDPKKPVALTAAAIWRGDRWLIYDMG